MRIKAGKIRIKAGATAEEAEQNKFVHAKYGAAKIHKCSVTRIESIVFY